MTELEEKLGKLDKARECLEAAEKEAAEALADLTVGKAIENSLKRAADKTLSEIREALATAKAAIRPAAVNIVKLHDKLKKASLREAASKIDPSSVDINVYIAKKDANFLYSEYASRTLNDEFDLADWEDPDGVYLNLDGATAMKIVRELDLSKDEVYWKQQKILTKLIDDIDDKLEKKGIIRVNGSGDAEFMDASKKPIPIPKD